MTQKERIEKARKLLVPVLTSVQGRCPKGMKPYDADSVEYLMARIVTDLEEALIFYPAKPNADD